MAPDDRHKGTVSTSVSPIEGRQGPSYGSWGTTHNTAYQSVRKEV